MLRSFWLSALIVLSLAWACSQRGAQRPRLSEDAFVRLFTEMAQSSFTHSADPEQLERAYELAMQENGLSQEALAQALSDFEDNPERWIPILEGILGELERLSADGAI